MSNVLILYYSRGGHTAKISAALAARIDVLGHNCDFIAITETATEVIDWSRYQLIVVGACVLYGSYHKSVFEFVTKHRQQLEACPNSFFCVNVVARNPEKRLPENNKYLQKFVALSPWQPQDVKIIAGKVDYPSWPWYDRWMIQLIMRMTNGPTDPNAVIDYTDWVDVDRYAEHLLTLAKPS